MVNESLIHQCVILIKTWIFKFAPLANLKITYGLHRQATVVWSRTVEEYAVTWRKIEDRSAVKICERVSIYTKNVGRMFLNSEFNVRRMLCWLGNQRQWITMSTVSVLICLSALVTQLWMKSSDSNRRKWVLNSLMSVRSHALMNEQVSRDLSIL